MRHALHQQPDEEEGLQKEGHGKYLQGVVRRCHQSPQTYSWGGLWCQCYYVCSPKTELWMPMARSTQEVLDPRIEGWKLWNIGFPTKCGNAQESLSQGLRNQWTPLVSPSQGAWWKLQLLWLHWLNSESHEKWVRNGWVCIKFEREGRRNLLGLQWEKSEIWSMNIFFFFGNNLHFF